MGSISIIIHIILFFYGALSLNEHFYFVVIFWNINFTLILFDSLSLAFCAIWRYIDFTFIRYFGAKNST